MTVLPLLVSASAEVSGHGARRRLLGHEADPWVVWGVTRSETEFEPFATVPHGESLERLERAGVEALRAREGHWRDCEVDTAPPDSQFAQFHLGVGRTLLSWEGDAFFGCERLLDAEAMALAAELLDTSLVVTMAPSRNALFACSGEALEALKPLLGFTRRFFRQANKPISPHAYFWDVEKAQLVGAIRVPLDQPER